MAVGQLLIQNTSTKALSIDVSFGDRKPLRQLLAPGASFDIAPIATIEQANVEPTLLALRLAGKISITPTSGADDLPQVGGAMDANRLLRDKYILASANRVHMDADLDILAVAPTGLAGGATQDQANARANLLKTYFLAHYTDVGTLTTEGAVDGAHRIADSTNNTTLTGQADASDLTSCINLIGVLKTTLFAHYAATGVHFNDDASSPSTITVDPPVTLADCITDLNDLRQAFVDHADLASQ